MVLTMANARIKDSPALQAMLRYSIVGCSGTLVDWALFAALHFLVGLHYLLAGTISFVIATLVNYGLGLLWVFEGGRHARHKEVTLIYLVSAIGLAVNLAVLYLLVESGVVHVFVAKVLASLSAFLWNFSARYLWIFQRPMTD